MPPLVLQHKQSGSFILEALISVVIFAVGLVALMGMSAQALNQIGQTKYRNDASYLASELIGSLWASASTPDTYDYDSWKARVAATLPGGTASVGDVPADPTDQINCEVPGTGKPSSTRICIKISWADKENVEHFYLTTTEVIKN